MSRRFANLSERLSADLPKDPSRLPEDDEDETTAETDGEGTSKKDKPMADNVAVEETAEYKAGFKAANDRMNAVFASDHYAGRERLAHSLLSKTMSAEDIYDSLAAAPKIEPAEINAEAIAEIADKAAREEMKDAIAETGNSNIDASGGNNKKDDAQVIAQIWDKAIARVYPNK